MNVKYAEDAKVVYEALQSKIKILKLNIDNEFLSKETRDFYYQCLKYNEGWLDQLFLLEKEQ